MAGGDESPTEFEAARQRKIEEIRRTGKTWQWPDTVVEHRKWTLEHKAALGWVLLSLACVAAAIWMAVRG